MFSSGRLTPHFGRNSDFVLFCVLAHSWHSRWVDDRDLHRDQLLLQLKRLVAEMFRLDILDPDKIGDFEFLGSGLGLDSIDMLELAFCIEEKFGIAICGREKWGDAFTSVASLADFICAREQAIAGPEPHLLGWVYVPRGN